MDRMFLLVLALMAAPVYGQGLCAPYWKAHPTVDVRVANGNVIQVSEATIETDCTETALAWWITDQRYEFPDKDVAPGITIRDMNGNPTDDHDCFRALDTRWFQCTKKNHHSSKQYKYTVNVLDTQTNKLVDPPLDPFIHNK